MLQRRQREVHWQDGERVNQQFKLMVNDTLHLFCRTVLLTKETGPLTDGFSICLGTRGTDACRIPLNSQRDGVSHQFTCLDQFQVTITLTHIVPDLQLTVEITGQRSTAGSIAATTGLLLTGMQFHRAKTILVQIIGIDLVNGQGGIGIASPTTAQIQLSKDTSYAVAAREHQSQRIVLAIAGIGESNAAQQRREEGSGCSQAIDAQGIVGTVLVSPLLVSNQSWRQRVQLKVTHTVGTDDHCGMLFVESVNNRLQRLRRGIEVIAVKLYGKPSAEGAVDSLVPATTNTQVSTFRNDDVKLLCMAFGKVGQNVGGTVGRMVIDDNDIIFEHRLLRQGTLNGITDSLHTVIDGNDDGSLEVKRLFIIVDVLILHGVNQCTDFAQMVRAGLLHLHLHIAVGRVHVVELLHARGTQVLLLFGIEVFIQMKQLTLTAQEKAEVVETSITVVGITFSCGIFVEQRRTQEHQ